VSMGYRLISTVVPATAPAYITLALCKKSMSPDKQSELWQMGYREASTCHVKDIRFGPFHRL
jgi:hypothetical protein